MPLPPKRRSIQAVMSAAALVALAWAGVMALRTWRAAAAESQALALAESSGQAALGYVEAALRSRPDDANLWRERAVYAGFAAPLAARAFARRAVALDPYDWRAWQTLGLLDYQLGDLAASRKALAQAVHYDHGFDSHFTLGNLALAQGNNVEFRREMIAALAIAPAAEAVYPLRAIVSHADLGPSGLAAALPADRADVVAEGIQYFMDHGKLAAAIAGWRRLRCKPYQFADCRRAVLALANGLVASAFASASPLRAERNTAPTADPELPLPAELVTAAVDAWNQSVRQGILSQAMVTVGGAADGAFQHAWVGPAFSWQSTRALPLQARQPSGVTLPFDGYQPDQAVLLDEFVPVAPATTYSLSYESRRMVAGQETGLRLVVSTAPDRVLATIPARLDRAWSLDTATFTVPAGIHVLLLAFEYARPNGQVRLHNPVLVAHLALQPGAK